VLGAELVWHIVLVAALFACGVFGIFTYAVDRGYSVELARTIALNTLVVMEIFPLFFITYLGALQGVFGTRAVPFLDGALIVGVGVCSLRDHRDREAAPAAASRPQNDPNSVPSVTTATSATIGASTATMKMSK
jgi:hypothetical protein